MARLPAPEDMQRLRAPSETPGIRVGTPDYASALAGEKAIGEGIKQIGSGLSVVAKMGEEVDDYETRKKLLDFKLETEMAQEEHKRNMPLGGGNYAADWQQQFKERVYNFVGKDDANIPASQRAKVGLLLKQFDVQMQERAARDQNAEADRWELDSLGLTLDKVKSRVEADPYRRDDMLREGSALIETSRLTPAARHKALQKFQKDIDTTAITSRLMRAQTAEDYDAIKRDLAPDAPDRRATGDVSGLLAKGRPTRAAGWAKSDPTWNSLTGPQKAAAMALMEADSADANDARNALGAMINRAARDGQDLGGHVSQAIYQPTFEPAQQKRLQQILRLPAFQELTQWAERRIKGEEADPVDGATHFLAHERTMLGLEAREPGKYSSWRGWTKFDGKSYGNVRTRDRSHAFLAPEGPYSAGADVAAPDDGSSYAGPYSKLSITERRTLWNQAEAQRAKQVAAIDAEIKNFEDKVAVGGNMLPAPVLQDLQARVNATGDRGLKNRLIATIGLAAETQRLQQMPPPLLEQRVRNMERDARENGATPERVKYIEHNKKILETVSKNTKEDPMTWAQRTGIALPIVASQGADGFAEPIKLEDLNFGAKDIDAVLARRMEQAKIVGRYYNQEPQVFTKGDRERLPQFLKQGGGGMLYVMGKIARAAADAGIPPDLVMKEFAGKDAPEIGMVGELVANNADPALLQSAANALSYRAAMKENFKSYVDRSQVKTDEGEYAEVMKNMRMKVDTVRALADLVYTYEAPQKGIKADSFNDAHYKDVIARIMGEVKTPDGLSYGGVGKQAGLSWWNWKKPTLVPPGVRTDMFDDMKGSFRAADFALAGVPKHDDGTPWTAAEVRQATWESVGVGRYVLVSGERHEGNRTIKRVAGTGRTLPDGSPEEFVLDVRTIMEPMRMRKPEMFMGYDGIVKGRDVQDPPEQSKTKPKPAAPFSRQSIDPTAEPTPWNAAN